MPNGYDARFVGRCGVPKTKLSQIVQQGALAPQGLTIAIEGNGLDCRLVRAVSFAVRGPNWPDTSEVSWPSAISFANAFEVQAQHPYVAGDVDIAGKYRIGVTLHLNDGTDVGCTTADLFVLAANSVVE